MSAALAVKRKWTAEEYLEMERDALQKHEFFDGEIFEMPGASLEHNRIVGNLTIALGNAVGDRCSVLPSDMRLFVPATGLYTYADVTLLSGEPDLTADNPPALTNPEAIFEVLSPSTESYDRGKKFENYRTIPSLQHYVLVAQDRVLVEHFSKQPAGGWLMQEARAGQSLHLPWGEVPVQPFYRRVL